MNEISLFVDFERIPPAGFRNGQVAPRIFKFNPHSLIMLPLVDYVHN